MTALDRTLAPVPQTRAQVRRRLTVRGSVQGVGFRPFVHRLAHEHGLAGWVRNDGDGVEIELQGEPEAVGAMLLRVEPDAPTLASIASIEVGERPLAPGASGFAIIESRPSPVRTAVVPDTAVCDACLRELFDPGNRRHRHPFISCTHCGPRYTIVEGLPYDRAATSMAAFAPCAACRREYGSTVDRRFHAQTIACPTCGPRLSLRDANGIALDSGDPIAQALARLRAGEILAIKGQGGFHLCCDAFNAHSVSRLRERKAREAKPFAVMVAGTASAARLAQMSADEARLLRGRERPIVLLPRRVSDADVPASVAPGSAWIGVMLPCTPVQHLLFHEAAGRPDGIAWLEAAHDFALVMTSGNRSGEPTACTNDEAFAQLGAIADAFLVHDCAIPNRCDDSVLRCGPDAQPRFLRRARGYAPQPIRLGHDGEAVLALGGDLKATLCVTRGSEAFVSEHVGDLEGLVARQALASLAQRLPALLQIEPRVIACDLHPDFASTRLAERIAQERGLPLVRVQHHHAHVAAALAEHGCTRPVIGIALDGAGYGSDGGLWGGELLRVDVDGMTRLGHLLPLRLPGGDRAAREPWRMAAAALHALGRDDEIVSRYPSSAGRAVAELLARGLRSPPSSSCGRWFDAAAALLGLLDRNGYEGHAAMVLEGLAERHGAAPPLHGGHAIDATGRLDLGPLLGYLAETPVAAPAAAVFHATLAAGLADWATRAARSHRLDTVVLAGGCFANRVLTDAVRGLLVGRGLRVLEPMRMPAGDGGLCLGQAWVARHTPRRH